MTLSLCVAGLGKYAEHVLSDARSSLKGIDLFFASRDVEKARDFNHRYGGMGGFASYEEAASDPRVDAIYFITPHHLHLENALLAAGNSKHILMEKPIARTVAEAEQIIAAARNAGVTLMIAENHRFLPTVALAKQMVEDGAIGRVRYVQAHAESYDVPGGWRADPELAGGGMLIDGGVHYVNHLVYLGGFPTSLYAAIPSPAAPGARSEDGVFLTAQLPGGVVGSLSFVTGTPVSRNFHRVSVTGDTGHIHYVPFGSEVTLDTPAELRTFQVPGHGRGVRQMLAEFRDCLAEGRDPKMTGEDGLRDLAVVLAAYRSARTGQPVLLDDLSALDPEADH